MNEQQIPAAAIEAAAMAILGVDQETWDLQTTGTKDRYRWDAQAALQAALPHLGKAPLRLDFPRLIEVTTETYPEEFSAVTREVLAIVNAGAVASVLITPLDKTSQS
ncbi:hypothetical protein [Arthrobacter sp. SD76]|uniref:hypothetical protein n=1 Tax=Arthrobacter sp. SD76 TaxID=3415007 RepID=UPI003C768198